MERIDETDRIILQALQGDAKLTVREIAAQTHLSPTPVYERIKKLEQTGVIAGYRAVIDPDKLGDGIIVFCNIRLKQHAREIALAFMEAIQRIPEVTECYNISGDYDFMIKVYVKSMPDYQDFALNTLGKIDSVGTIHSIFVFKEVKNTHGIPL